MAQNVIINGVTYSNVPEVDIPTTGGGTAEFYDTSDATLSSGNQMLSGATAYANGTKYTGSITTKAGTDLTVTDDTVNVPAGYYATATSKAVAAGTAKTPTTTITANPTISVSSSGLITANVTGSQNITPSVTAGYVSSGTAGAVSVSGTKTEQLTTQAATTITPGTTAQTIASGTYLTGAVTVVGDTDLIGGNIVAGHNIFGVEGTATLVSVTQDSTTKVLSIS